MNMAEILETRTPRLKYKILQSPMCGCTDIVYRRVARRFGCQIAFTEMVKDRAIVERNERTFEILRTADWDHPLGMQVAGREPALMAEAARIMESLGADVVDVNLGCPVPKVVEQGCGAALLKEPEQVARILDAMVASVRIPVTIKMRTGFDEGDDDGFLRIVRQAGEHGAAAVTVHGRTRKQMYKGFSNHEAIRAAKSVARIPVIGNGDLRSGADAKRMIEATGCDGVMLARGALGNPWLYREVERVLEGGTAPPAPTVREKATVLREHFELLRELHGDRNASRLVRRVLHWYVKGSAGSAALRERANRLESPEAFEAIVSEFAESHLEDSAKDAKLWAG
jgi:nifR3 family TIM-barrel protein